MTVLSFSARRHAVKINFGGYSFARVDKYKVFQPQPSASTLLTFWLGVALLVPRLSQRPGNALWRFVQIAFLPARVMLATLIKVIWT